MVLPPLLVVGVAWLVLLVNTAVRRAAPSVDKHERGRRAPLTTPAQVHRVTAPPR